MLFAVEGGRSGDDAHSRPYFLWVTMIMLAECCQNLGGSRTAMRVPDRVAVAVD